MSDGTMSQGALAGFFATYALVFFVIFVLTIIAMWKIFEKAGKPGWAAIIPVYNFVVMFQIVGLSPWLLLLYIVPLVNSIAVFILTIIMNIRLAKAFGKGTGFILGLIFLSPIFDLILGFGDSQYVGIPE